MEKGLQTHENFYGKMIQGISQNSASMQKFGVSNNPDYNFFGLEIIQGIQIRDPGIIFC